MTSRVYMYTVSAYTRLQDRLIYRLGYTPAPALFMETILAAYAFDFGIPPSIDAYLFLFPAHTTHKETQLKVNKPSLVLPLFRKLVNL